MLIISGKQEAWWPNKLCCIIRLTKLLAYYVRSGDKERPNVECHHMASVYYKRENQSRIRRPISDRRQDLGPMGPFEAALGTSCKMNLSLFWPILQSKRTQKYCPCVPIFYTLQSSSSELKRQVSCKFRGNLLQNWRKLFWNWCWSYSESQRTQKYGPWGPYSTYF